MSSDDTVFLLSLCLWDKEKALDFLSGTFKVLPFIHPHRITSHYLRMLAPGFVLLAVFAGEIGVSEDGGQLLQSILLVHELAAFTCGGDGDARRDVGYANTCLDFVDVLTRGHLQSQQE